MNVWVIARTTTGEALRKKVLNVFLLVAVVMIVLSVVFAFFTPREEITIVRSMSFGAIVIFGVLISVIMSIGLIPNEVEKRTIYTLLAKPVRRWEFIVGKFLGAALTIFINVALMCVVFVMLVAIKTHQIQWDLFLGVLLIYFGLTLLAAIAIFFSVVLTPNINVALTLALYIVGNLSEYTEAMARLAVQRSQNVILSYAIWALHYLVPNFSNFNIQHPMIHPENVTVEPTFMILYAVKAILYALMYIAALLFAAVLLFDNREL